MTKYTKTVSRALELLGESGDSRKGHLRVKDEEVEDLATWVVAHAESTLGGLAESDRLDAESVALVLAEIDDMESEAIAELQLAARVMARDELEREKWLEQRVEELKSILDVGGFKSHKVSAGQGI